MSHVLLGHLAGAGCGGAFGDFAGPRGGGKCGPHGVGRGGKTGARPSLGRLDNCQCNFWIANGEADFSTFSC
jgi:hypothetical protein